MQNDTILLEVKNLNKTFPVKKEKLYDIIKVKYRTIGRLPNCGKRSPKSRKPWKQKEEHHETRRRQEFCKQVLHAEGHSVCCI